MTTGAARVHTRRVDGVTYHGYDVAGYPTGVHRGLPSPHLTLVIGIDDPLTMLGADGPVARDVVIGGLHAEPVTIAHEGRRRGIYVAVDPLVAGDLFGMPAGALRAPDLDGADVLGALAPELHERVNTAPDWRARFAVLDALLPAAAGRGAPTPGAEVRRAWQRLVRGGVAVRAVADEVGWSERHLGRRFRAEFGVGPKTLARMARFDRVRHRLAVRAEVGMPLGLAELAADGGYADQSHLSREFVALAGCSPTTWVREEVQVGNVQDPTGAGGAPSRP